LFQWYFIFLLLIFLKLGNGNIADALGLNSGGASSISGLINEGAKLQEAKKNSALLSASVVGPKIKTTLDGMRDDIKLSYKGTDADSPTLVLAEWYKYVDSSVKIYYKKNF
jgi:hypothetical protein